jgi:enoyl-CoA hydratase/carnithine racemase
MSIIESTIQGHIAIYTINRPKARGALNIEGMKQLQTNLLNFRDNDNLWVAIITGTGDQIFSAGVDAKEYLPFIKKIGGKNWLKPEGLLRGFFHIWKPIIAACNGLTVGGGLELSLACDIIIASENATFGLPEVKLGLCPGGGGTQRLPRSIPIHLAAEMLFTGKTINAQEAFRIGLINKVVPSNNLMSEAIKMAESICKAGPLAVRTAKESLYRGLGMTLEEGLQLEEDMTQHIMATEDFEEGIKAFAEKRKPKFQGK